MPRKLWRIELAPGVHVELQRIRREETRGEEAVEGWMHWVARSPESGFAVAHVEGAFSRPFHTGTNAYLVVYRIHGEVIRCVSIRPVPYSGLP
jgi:hypothetical protein